MGDGAGSVDQVSGELEIVDIAPVVLWGAVKGPDARVIGVGKGKPDREPRLAKSKCKGKREVVRGGGKKVPRSVFCGGGREAATS